MKILYRLMIGLAIIFFLCLGSFGLNFVFTAINLQNNFCSADNAIYKIVKLNGDSWRETFQANSNSLMQNIELGRINNKIFYASTYRNNPAETPSLMFINVGSDIDSLRGSEGFLYVFPDKLISRYWFNNYWITQLDENTYCYKIRGF